MSTPDPKPDNIIDALEAGIEREPRVCAYIPADAFDEGQDGYRVSFVKEGESGHFPTGVWPYDPRKPKPWFWGPSFREAKAAAKEYNKQLGLSEDDVNEIRTSSLKAGFKEQA